jgi:hypothetical protein
VTARAASNGRHGSPGISRQCEHTARLGNRPPHVARPPTRRAAPSQRLLWAQSTDPPVRAWLRCLRERVRVVTRRHTGRLFGLPPEECQGWGRSAAVPFEDRLPDNTDDRTPHGSHRIGRRKASPDESRDHRGAKTVRARVGSQMFANWHD